MDQPLARSRAGQISCAIWENETQVNATSMTVLKAPVSGRYKDRDGNWQSSQSFGRNGIPLVVYCLRKAFEKVIGEEQGQDGSNEVREEVVGALSDAETLGRPEPRP